ncbi:Wide host range VirA protein [Pirellulimonas nuda]|uniref:histidine kinase n=1 Tax=Pirellulimonas nuda TaxID=2528009 RepID=A0A518D9H6_9BACT|nr:HAMP domain-containing sensor histidine kinase [Pirellulimonas nuda]QDU88086.1 Wide host range VirA protein [Pirellulimonas nuda]
MQAGKEGSTAELQVEVQALRQQLLEAQKMASLGELVGTTTHEFNNALTTILNYAKLGLRHKDQPTRDKALEKIMSAAQRAEKIANSVLGMARNRGHDPAPTDLGALAEETLVLLERELMKYRVSVEKRYETGRRALVVANQVQQVLVNLLTNARQAMPKGGVVMVRVAEDAAREWIELTVRDNGEGIPPDVLPRIFERRFSTKQGPDETGKGGMGLGLSACKEIVEAHGGKIRVESTPGRGTAFVLRLPAAPAEAAIALVVPLGVPVDCQTFAF